MYLSMVCGMFVCVSVFTVSNALLMSNATAMVRVGGMCWWKPVATVLCFDVWYVLCYVRKNHLLDCLCDNR